MLKNDLFVPFRIRVFCVLFLFLFWKCDAQECFDQQYSNNVADLRTLHLIQRIAVIAPLGAFYIQTSNSGESDEAYSQEFGKLHYVKSPNGETLVVYSSISSSHLEWQTVNLLTTGIRVVSVFENDVQEVSPVIVITACPYKYQPIYLDAQPFAVDTHQARLVSMYENELIINFRTFENGIFFFSMADQGDMLVAQLSDGRAETIFDFGSLSKSSISGGQALNDGQWHELKWTHQFDSVQLFVDNVLVNQTTPPGLYRKLDFNYQLEIGGRPEDQYSSEIQTTYHGCLARVLLNNVNLLDFAPSGVLRECHMPHPQTLTLKSGSVQLAYSFLPFTVEFRLLSKPASLINILNSANQSLLEILVDESLSLALEAESKQIKQSSNPAISVADGAWHYLSIKLRGGRLDIDLDGTTVLWLEGTLVRKIGLKMTAFRLSAVGCYRSTTVDLKSAELISGELLKDRCFFVERCLPNPCQNGGICAQPELDSFRCNCPKHYTGTFCHTSLLPRSCEDHRLKRRPRSRNLHPNSDGHWDGENVTIDLDGGETMKPGISILDEAADDYQKDELDSEVTLLMHDLPQDGIQVAGPTEPGAVKRILKYADGTISGFELDRFVDGFESCRQYMRFECRGGTKLMSYGNERRPSTWYSTRNEQHGLQWAEAPPYSRMCGCGVNATCENNRLCNCDSGHDGVDEGWNTYHQLLPVMQLFMGGTGSQSLANVSIGPLRCSKRRVFEAVTFMDRNEQLVGSQTFNGALFDVYLQVRFTHLHMTIFTWESVSGERWFQLFVREGKIIGQLVNAGRSHELVSDVAINDNRWHSVYWEIDSHSMRLTVDRREKSISSFFLLPVTLTYIIGSRTGRANTGFAGQLRNFYLCGEEILLAQMAAKTNSMGIRQGQSGHCSNSQYRKCLNSGECVELYDSFKCNCSMTPFGGDKCEQEVGMWVPLGSQVSIPWQHPSHMSSTCYRMNIYTESKGVSLIRAKALFAESNYNMSLNENGHLNVQMYDGFFFQHNVTFDKFPFNDGKMKDVKFCASKTEFKITVNEEIAVLLEGNFSFFVNLNSWHFVDKNFTGCVSRLKIGSGFPLKNPPGSRLSHSGAIKFSSCPFDPIEYHKTLEQAEMTPDTMESDSEIHISAIVKSQQRLLLITPAIGLLTAFLLMLALCLFVWYLRGRPDGVYKTNEDILTYRSPSKSAEPLVQRPAGVDTSAMFTKEYFC
ncbi:laminin G domain-containing protein [Ditylenchus destructor]|nr:laminin G domain-containing protein [Ditylenchus destructor]